MRRPLVVLPPTLPSECALLPPTLRAREQELYACSDSDEERVVVPAVPICRRKYKAKLESSTSAGVHRVSAAAEHQVVTSAAVTPTPSSAAGGSARNAAEKGFTADGVPIKLTLFV